MMMTTTETTTRRKNVLQLEITIMETLSGDQGGGVSKYVRLPPYGFSLNCISIPVNAEVTSGPGTKQSNIRAVILGHSNVYTLCEHLPTDIIYFFSLPEA